MTSSAELETSADTFELGDCSGNLGDCYVACQNTPPTPDAGCFTKCECSFYRCIEAPYPDGMVCAGPMILQ